MKRLNLTAAACLSAANCLSMWYSILHDRFRTRMNDPIECRLSIGLVVAEPAARLGISYYFSSFSQVDVSEADTALTGEMLFLNSPPDVALVDADIDGGGGLELIRRVQRAPHGTPCVAWIRHARQQDVMAAVKVRPRGIVCRRESLPEIALALFSAYIGYVHFSEAVSMALGHGIYSLSDLVALQRPLPSRQLQVFRLLGSGLNSVEISRRLGISVATVHTHIERIKARLNCQSQARLAALAASDLAREE